MYSYLTFAAAVPDAPRNLRVFARSPVSVSVSWDSPANSDAVVLGYSVYYYDVSSSETVEAVQNVTSNTCTLVALRKFHQYSVRVVAFGANGLGASAPEVFCRTLSDGWYLSSYTYPCRWSQSTWVACLALFVCLFVYLSVCLFVLSITQIS